MKRSVPLVLAVALFMEQMDSTVIATALPAIAADIGTDPIALKLALTAYLVALGIFIPVSGWAADRFGARRVFAAAIAVFVAGSVACAGAGSLGGFVAARFLQGMGGAMMTPIGRLVLVRGTPKSELVEAMAWLTVPALLGPLAGPPLGGFLTTWFSWHWIFIINVPIGLAGIVFALTVLPGNDRRDPGRVDWTGFALSGTAAAGIVFGLSVISLPALPPAAGWVAVAAGLLAIPLYLRHARRHPAPLIALDLFRNRVFSTCMLGANIFRLGVGAVPFLLPLMLQLGFGMTAFQSGMITFISAAGAIAMKFVIGRILRRGGFRAVLIWAGVLSALTIAVTGTFVPSTPVPLIMLLLFAGGLVRSLFFTSINALTYAEMEDASTAQATAVVSAVQQVSIALAVAVAGGLLGLIAGPGGSPGLGAFHTTFFVVALISAAAIPVMWRLPSDAGSYVSGRHVEGAGSRAAQPVHRGG